MAGHLLPECQKKRGRNLDRSISSFPIVMNRMDPTVSFANSGSQFNHKCFIGQLKEDSVLIEDTESIKLLYTMGFFGKGTFSKGAPKVCCEDEAPQPDTIALSSASEEVEDEKDWKRKRRKLMDNENETDAETEKLQLTFEESYFLSYGLGCLLVMDGDQPLNLQQLWEKFCNLALDQRFPITYTAYHHFRCKGWVVRTGLKYGVDYTLYRKGPPFYHSTYAVIVKSVKEASLENAMHDHRLEMSWASISAITRVLSQVAKSLLMLYVVTPDIVLKNKTSTPYCLSQFKVEEVIVKRWVPEAGRDES